MYVCIFICVATNHPKVKELGKLIKDLLPFPFEEIEVFSPPPYTNAWKT